ncbi:MAG TPA: ShlB/FhaC/HecB family hemolysin secretion/activation protein, partial [Burkholderiales bacterium]|nr:ShlB/FhaC/HecB family hemolysin secretion/activation protein [Burkholderiales bacterium]
FRKPPPELLQLPPVKPPEADRAPTALRVMVKKINITGNTVFKAGELESIAAPFENREVTSTDLEELRQRLTQHYINAGYINSGAVIPDQKVEDGVIEIRIVEGRLTRTEIEGTVHFSKDYFSDRIALSSGPPLNLRELEQRLQVLLTNPMVASINAQVVPGERPGEAVLRAQVQEAPRYELSAVLDNKLAPSLGEAKLTLLGAVNNLTGRGDQLGAEFGYAGEGIPHDARLRYRTPISARDTALGVHYENTKAVVQEEPFDVLDITSKLETVGVELSHPVYRTQNRQLVLSGLVERRETETTLLGVPFSFSPGVQDGKATVSVLRLIADYLDRGRTQVIAARSTLNIGLDAFDSTINTDGSPDSRFVSWLGQLQYVRRLSERRGDQLRLRADLQLTDDALLPVEQYAVGGLDSVRGYRSFQLLRDYGYTASIEYRIPVFSNPVGARNLLFAAYVDTGGAKFKERDNPSPDNLTGVGIGFIWNPVREFFAELYYAEGLDDVPAPASSHLQDESLYFRLVYRPSWF